MSLSLSPPPPSSFSPSSLSLSSGEILTVNFTARRRYEKVVEERDVDEGEDVEDFFSRIGYAPFFSRLGYANFEPHSPRDTDRRAYRFLPVALRHTGVERLWHMNDGQSQILAWAFRASSLKSLELFPLLPEAATHISVGWPRPALPSDRL